MLANLKLKRGPSRAKERHSSRKPAISWGFHADSPANPPPANYACPFGCPFILAGVGRHGWQAWKLGGFWETLSRMPKVLIESNFPVDPISQTVVSALVYRQEGIDVRVWYSLACLLVLALGAAEAQAQWPYATTPQQNEWWVEVGGRVYDRLGSDLGLPLIISSVTNETYLDSDKATDLNAAAGPDIRFGRRGAFGREWEFVTNMARWREDVELQEANMFSPLFPLFEPDFIRMEYNSTFYNLELNARNSILPGVTLLAGPRYMNLQEQMQFNTETLFVDNGFAFLLQTEIASHTRNSMIGGQVGLELNQPIARDIYLQGFIKVAGMGNQTRLIETSFDNFSNVRSSNELTKATGTFIGQTGGRVYFEMVPRRVASWVGYEATWIDGVTIAPPQMLNTDVNAPVVTANTIFWHAITFGVKFGY